jgi:hypothetical protein
MIINLNKTLHGALSLGTWAMEMGNFKYKYSTKEERVSFFENIDSLSLQFAWQLPLRIETSTTIVLIIVIQYS